MNVCTEFSELIFLLSEYMHVIQKIDLFPANRECSQNVLAKLWTNVPVILIERSFRMIIMFSKHYHKNITCALFMEWFQKRFKLDVQLIFVLECSEYI